jgi:hypothetical protein
MKTQFLMRASTVSLCAMLCMPVAATTVLVTGTLTNVEFGLSSEFHVGQAYSWSYTFDPGAHDFNVTATRGDYRGAILAGSLSIGGYTASTSGGTIVVDDGTFGSGFDQYTVEIDNWNGSVAGPLIAGRFPYAIGMELDDPTDTALLDDLLATSLPTITQYPSRGFTFSFAQSTIPSVAFGVQRVYGTVDSITEVHEIPEPPAALLVLAGLFAAFSGARVRGREPGRQEKAPRQHSGIRDRKRSIDCVLPLML